MNQHQTMETGVAAKEADANNAQANTRPTSPSVGFDDFKQVSTLGKGTYGVVFLVRKQSGIDQGKLFAAKINLELESKEFAEKELQIMEAVKNTPFLLQLKYTFNMCNGPCLLFQYLNRGHLWSRSRYSTYEVIFITAELVLAVEQLHKLGIIHRDIKLNNILLDDDSHIVLCDFGAAVQFSEDDEIKKTRENYVVSAYSFAAPEIVSCQEHGFASDWWSVGVVMYNLLTKRYPFYGYSNLELFRRITSCKPDIDRRLPPAIKNLIKELLEKDEDKRLGTRIGGVGELKSHDVFTGINWDDLLRKKYISPVRRAGGKKW